MYLEQTLATKNQMPPLFDAGPTTRVNVSANAMLGNESVQRAPAFTNVVVSDLTLIEIAQRGSRSGVSPPVSKLQALKRERFTLEDKAERIEKSLAALNQPEPIRLTAEEWRWVAEDPDLEDQS